MDRPDDVLRKLVFKAIDRRIGPKVERVQQITSEAANAYAKKFLSFVAAELLGRASMPFLGEFSPHPAWAKLGEGYTKKKGNNLFFQKTGNLRAELSGQKASEALGRTTVTSRWGGVGGSEGIKDQFGAPASSRRIFIYPFHKFTVGSDLSNSDTDEKLARFLDNALGGHGIYTKLMNTQYNHGMRGHGGGPVMTPSRYRPILLPAMLFFIKYKLGWYINAVLGTKGFTVRK